MKRQARVLVRASGYVHDSAPGDADSQSTQEHPGELLKRVESILTHAAVAVLAMLVAALVPFRTAGAQEVEPMAREAFDGFRVHCLANLANPKLVRDGAKEMKYAPVAADLAKRLGTDEAWYIPSDKGSVILGLNAKGHCGVVAQEVDVAAFARLLEQRLQTAAAVDEVADNWRTRIYSIVFDNRTATIRLRQAVGAAARGPISVTVSDARVMDTPPAVVAAPAPVPAPAPAPLRPKPAEAAPAPTVQPSLAQAAPAAPQPAAPQPVAPQPVAPAVNPAAAAPAALGPGPRVRPQAPPPPAKAEPQPSFPTQAAIDAWDPAKRVVENVLVVQFADACFQTRAQPADVLQRAQQQKWRTLQANLIGGGFDFAWSTPEQPPEQVMVFYDSLKARCCASMFGVHKLDLLAAATRRFTLVPDKAFTMAGKEVLQFKQRKDYRMTIDFEPAGDGTAFANMCYLSR